MPDPAAAGPIAEGTTAADAITVGSFTVGTAAADQRLLVESGLRLLDAQLDRLTAK